MTELFLEQSLVTGQSPGLLGYVDIPNTSAIAQGRYALLNVRLTYAPRRES